MEYVMSCLSLSYRFSYCVMAMYWKFGTNPPIIIRVFTVGFF
jgi:hypothetical protein